MITALGSWTLAAGNVVPALGTLNPALGTAGVALGVAGAFGGVITMAGALASGRPRLLRMARVYAWIILVGAVIAVIAMQRGLITRDFTLEYVFDNGSTRTPPLFNVATMWSALEGSILLWALVLAGYVVAVIHKFRDRLADPLVGWAALTMFAVALFFFVLMVGPANPFTTVDPPFGYEGPGPNPLLQNHILVAFHPPLLYLGFVGFTVPFAFAVAALVTGRVGEGWLVETRRWTLFAWGFLTFGIILGAWWSYEVLGWGGYWAWDPVENASFLPWLTGTAFLHSVMVQERRGMLRVWNLSLVCATFALTILGTFLTRSGVVASVHAFSAGEVGGWLLAFFGLIAAVTIGLVAWRGDELRAPGKIDSPRSREAAFLLNNLLFAAFAFVVLLGTVFPLIVEALRDDRISVGAPYFDRMTTPIGLALLFLMAIAPILPWRKASTEVLSARLLVPGWFAAGALAIAVVAGERTLITLLGYGLAGFAGGAALRQIGLATRRQGWRGLAGRANGGMIVHLGVIVLAIGFIASSGNVVDREVTLRPNESAEVGGHTVTYLETVDVQDPQRRSIVARVQVDDSGVYEPRSSFYLARGTTIGEPSVRPGLIDDVLLQLLRSPTTDDGPVVIRVIVQPLVTWIWVGGIMMLVGTILAAFPGRRRRGTEPVSALIGDPVEADEPDLVSVS